MIHRRDGFLYTAEMTDALTEVAGREKWQNIKVRQLGSLARLFAHLARVRTVYRDSLYSGEMQFPGRRIPRGTDLKAALTESREALAEALAEPKVEQVKVGEESLSVDEVYAAAIQHEGLHQGQWHVALKQLGLPVPPQWERDWGLGSSFRDSVHRIGCETFDSGE